MQIKKKKTTLNSRIILSSSALPPQEKLWFENDVNEPKGMSPSTHLTQ
jgi:hypothetical protein